MTVLEAYNEITSAIWRAEYVDSDYADSVDIWALKVCERLLRERLEAVKAAIARYLDECGEDRERIDSYDILRFVGKERNRYEISDN